MKKSIVTSLLFIMWIVSSAQEQIEVEDSRPRHSISLNLAGDGTLISLNFDGLKIINSKFFLSSKTGIGYTEEFSLFLFDSGDDFESFTTFSQHFTMNIGEGRNFFEIGVGGTFFFGDEDLIRTYPVIGYRFLPFKTSEVTFRAFVNVFSEFFVEDLYLSPIGLSMGITF